jgi:hypothetical protein
MAHPRIYARSTVNVFNITLRILRKANNFKSELSPRLVRSELNQLSHRDVTKAVLPYLACHGRLGCDLKNSRHLEWMSIETSEVVDYLMRMGGPCYPCKSKIKTTYFAGRCMMTITLRYSYRCNRSKECACLNIQSVPCTRIPLPGQLE